MNYALQTRQARLRRLAPGERAQSPFFTRYCTRVFRSEDDLFAMFARPDVTSAERPSSS